MQGLTTITRWFGQKIEFLIGGQGRRFDQELNSDIMMELQHKVDSLGIALATCKTEDIIDAAIDVGACCNMLAFNAYKGVGFVKVAPPPPKVEASTGEAPVAADDPFADDEEPKFSLKLPAPRAKRKIVRKSKK